MVKIAALGLSVLGWGGCDREPVEPPATPPAERAPELRFDAAEPRSPTTILIDARRRLG